MSNVEQMLEKLLSEVYEEKLSDEGTSIMKEVKAKMLSNGISFQDFHMFQAIFGWTPELSQVAKFLSIMCKDFDHLQSAELAKVFAPFLIQAAEFMHVRLGCAKVDVSILGLQPMEHTRKVLTSLSTLADEVIAKHQLLRSLAH